MGLNGQERGFFTLAYPLSHHCNNATAHEGPSSKCFKKLHSPLHSEVSLYSCMVLCRIWDGPGLSFPSYSSSSFWKVLCEALETEIPLLCEESQKVSEVGVSSPRN